MTFKMLQNLPILLIWQISKVAKRAPGHHCSETGAAFTAADVAVALKRWRYSSGPQRSVALGDRYVI